MSNWNPNTPGSSNVPPPLGSGGATESCVECGKSFPADEMIHHGNVSVCANCKPVFMQKLAEGARIDPHAFRYAGFWIRLVAYIVDLVVMSVFGGVVGLIFGVGTFAVMSGHVTTDATMRIVGNLIGFIIGVSYETFMIGKFGATLGKIACKIKVVTAEGERVSYLRALGRYFSKFLSGIIVGLGYIMAGFDPEKRALHDRICNTRVIYK